ncbi:hypothetical protein AB0D74_49490, partial [Streptomyces sp. NPDC048278]|uniref:hypothetical protein n=1 Tax=Streptomyces sp. NPDC048278 TaxID=3155809 RepID=UPI003434FA15
MNRTGLPGDRAQAISARLLSPRSSPGRAAWPITLENWQDAPLSRWGFAHAEQIVPAAVIR